MYSYFVSAIILPSKTQSLARVHYFECANGYLKNLRCHLGCTGIRIGTPDAVVVVKFTRSELTGNKCSHLKSDESHPNVVFQTQKQYGGYKYSNLRHVTVGVTAVLVIFLGLIAKLIT